ncbi:peptidylprolyl isomerase [Fischerella thermalis]|uniref:peptidylprolyl isomerase n=1 Tax=Fischerella thermalis TaxID=372787 RepID=UPI0019FAB5E6|nr:peptidylprolyl isomerase [Fischerella thermalis]MBF1991078.1 peptidylprolyl isomerase [Fischerella thermalis M58_A2018_009]MBF2059780.1 peptidylprolyl isomerase [Fischerella thermalis M66_A2018_004]MBF2069522.1 peptidylprolyl isomerase [Fischerella thermalis M48_A2018_028]
MTIQTLQVGNEVLQANQLLSLLHRYQLLPQVLRAKVIDEAIAPFNCTEAEKQAAIASFRARYQLTSPEEQQAWLQQHQLTEAEMQELAIRPVLIKKFQLLMWGRKLESYFLQRKANLDQVVYSLIRTKDEGLAQELYFRICEGEQSFASAAEKYSQGPEAKTGGVLGPVPLSQPHPVIQQILSISQPGQLWEPRAIAEWFVIIRLEKLMPAQLNDAMQQQLLDELFETWIQKQVQTRLQSSSHVMETVAA